MQDSNRTLLNAGVAFCGMQSKSSFLKERVAMKTENRIDRRTFLKTAGIGCTSMAVSTGIPGNALSAEATNNNTSKKMPVRVLGKTGVPVSILGMGGSVDVSGYQTLLRIGLNMGVNYWDSANSYGNGKNEQAIGEFFGKYPEERKKVFQATKASRTTDPKGMTDQLNLSLERMKTDYIDLYFIHMLQDPGLLTPEIKAWAEQKKKEGKIRFFGFSCHANMTSTLTRASKLGWIDALMTSYNYQLMNDDDMKKAVDDCDKAGIGLIAMKTQGQRIGPPANMPGGQGGRMPGSDGQKKGQDGETMPPPAGPQGKDSTQGQDDVSAMTHFINKGYTLEQAKLKAVWEDKRIAVCLSEMTSLTMLKDNVVAAVDGVKLSKKDRDVLEGHALNNRGLYCQGCMRCESVTDGQCMIPDVLRYMMYYNSYGKTDDARRLFRELPEHVRNSMALRDYSSAERTCPNRIQIGKLMRKASAILGQPLG